MSQPDKLSLLSFIIIIIVLVNLVILIGDEAMLVGAQRAAVRS